MNKAIRSLFAMLVVLLAWQVSFAQRTITGVVKDPKGQPIIGASVIVKGTTVGTYTDVDGKYTVSVPANNSVLTVKYLGYKQQDISLGANNIQNVTLEEDVLGLNEVVVTALGISREKKSLGTSTQTIDGGQIGTTGSGSVLKDLNGKVSGLTVINSSGTPGGGTYIRLRGSTAITGDNAPLMVVDGVPLDNSINNFDPTNGGFNEGEGAVSNPVGGVNVGNRGNDINPDDIASITVLKGPAATALYGIRAAGGALIITTKKGGYNPGHKGPSISISSSYSTESVNQFPSLQYQYSQGSNGTWTGPTGGSAKKFSWGAAIDTLYWDGVANDYDRNGNIVGQSSPNKVTKVSAYDNLRNFYVPGQTFNNNIAFSGGNENSGYRFSLGNNYQKGVIPLSTYSKTTFSASGQTNLSSKLKASASLTYTLNGGNKPQNGSNVSGVMLGLLRTPATFDDANGTLDPANNDSSYLLPSQTQRDYRGGPGYDNPYWTINRNIFTESLNRVYGFGQLDYSPFSWMNLTYRIGGDAYGQSNTNSFDIGSNAIPTGTQVQDDYFNRQFNSDLILTMHKDFSSNFNAQLILGHNYFVNNSSEHYTQGNGFAIPDFFSMSNASSYLSKRISSIYRTMAFYGDLTLGFKDQLFLDATGREETSSTLPASKNSFFFPSASLSWVFTDALGLSSSKVFPYGKLRGSIAQVGKDAPVQSLQTYYTSASVLDGFTVGDIFPFTSNSGVSVPGYQYSNQVNVEGDPNLKPYLTTSYEGGLDLAFFENRLSLSGTYYYEKTKDQIFDVPLAPSTGFAFAILNAGAVQNQGVEATLGITPVKTKSGFQWDFTFNWSKNQSKVTSLYPGIERLFLGGFGAGEAEIDAAAGEPFGVIYGTDFVRTSTGQLVLDDNPADQGGFGYAQPQLGQSVVKIGDPNPNWIGSVSTTLSYKGVSLMVQVDVKDGGDMWNGTRGALAYIGTAGETGARNTTKTFQGVLGHLDANGNLVHYDAEGNEVAGAGAQNTTETVLNQYYWQNIGNSFTSAQSADIENGGYVKLREVDLGYTLPQKWATRAKLNSLSLTLFATNIILNTKYDGVDPETSLTGPTNSQGLEYFNNPGVSSFGIRLNLGL